MIEITDWHNLYGDGWTNIIHPEAFSHPAKFSRALIGHIYNHCAAEGWLVEGDSIIDPFGGVALGGLDAMRLGLHWTGIELEPRFVALGNENIALWNKRYAGRFAKWGTARIVEGDSRRLLAVVGGAAAACVSSPPFGESIASDTRVGKAAEYTGHKAVEYAPTDGNLGNLPATDSGLAAAISSPPYAGSSPEAHSTGIDLEKNYRTYRAQGGGSSWEKFVASRARHQDGYGQTAGQLGAMPAGSFDASIASPPFSGSQQVDNRTAPVLIHGSSWKKRQGTITDGVTDGQLANLPEGNFDASIASPPFLQTSGGTNVTSADGPLSDPALIARHAAGNSAAEAYGADQANLGNMAEGEYAAAVSSPPYEKSLDDNHYGDGIDWNKAERTNTHGGRHQAPGQSLSSSYGIAPGNIGSAGSDDFWTAARAIVDQTHAALRPGGHAIWVVKDFVRNKQRVPFSSQWRQLCEAAGFVTLHEHRAWVVENNGTQLAHDGNHKAHVTERKSFFRRLAEKKGSPRIDFETVYCMVKSV